MRRAALLAAALALLLAGCSEAPAGKALVRVNLDGSTPAAASAEAGSTPSAAAAVASACRELTFEGVSLTHCLADPAQHRIAMANLGPDRQPFGTLAAWAASVDPGAIAFAVNGGMYGDDLRPLGYYVEASERLSPLNRGSGEGNFYMQPNGVFFGSESRWRVLTTEAFFNTVGDRPEFGTQSGPMLLIEGKLHPAFQDNGPSRAVRNGVGVDAEGRAHILISNAPVSFGLFARAFRDELKVANALCLDAQVSALWDPAAGRLDKGRVGPIIVVTRRAVAPPPAATAPEAR